MKGKRSWRRSCSVFMRPVPSVRLAGECLRFAPRRSVSHCLGAVGRRCFPKLKSIRGEGGIAAENAKIASRLPPIDEVPRCDLSSSCRALAAKPTTSCRCRRITTTITTNGEYYCVFSSFLSLLSLSRARSLCSAAAPRFNHGCC